VAQATEPSVLVPITHGCRQLVLLGDHRQLRPTVVSDAAAEGGLRFSLFERLIKCGVPSL
jgi:regulator of nonsense transcripts 1